MEAHKTFVKVVLVVSKQERKAPFCGEIYRRNPNESALDHSRVDRGNNTLRNALTCLQDSCAVHAVVPESMERLSGLSKTLSKRARHGGSHISLPRNAATCKPLSIECTAEIPGTISLSLCLERCTLHAPATNFLLVFHLVPAQVPQPDPTQPNPEHVHLAVFT